MKTLPVFCAAWPSKLPSFFYVFCGEPEDDLIFKALPLFI
jgi:hypothetical protein